ncbi:MULTISPECIES: DoxX family membrane protein [Actinomadura]|uniref:DoxX family membrane protein n=1 Tax=Actinomadura yumaensis TaxID=111807 RepID=A0ABW2CV62_9ACTN|nr:DoxX family membrane protein [Actinomadura sp. J1-007]MWK40623.1 DoxX family membrane protein [Actinomadura sp. J1-007]
MPLETPLRPPAHRTAAPTARYAWAATRIFLGWIFLWAFIDKLLGFGKSAPEGWVDGTSPSKGFLSSVDGPFQGMFHAMAGALWVDALYMFGLIGLGVALVLGIGLRAAAVGGTLLIAMLWAASLWPEANPFMDEHWIYAGVLISLALSDAGETWGLARPWSRTAVVRRFPFLR